MSKQIQLSRKKMIRAISQRGTLNTHDNNYRSDGAPIRNFYRGFRCYNVLPTEVLKVMYRIIVLKEKGLSIPIAEFGPL